MGEKFYVIYGNGRTYSTSNVSLSAYRPDGTVKLDEGDGGWVATLTNQEWVTYTISTPTEADYTFTLRYLTDENSPMITLYIDNVECDDIFSESTHGSYVETSWSAQHLTAGVHVVKILIQGENANISLSALTYSADITAYDITLPDGVTAPTRAAEGQTVAVTAGDEIVRGSLIIYDSATDQKLASITTAEGCKFSMPAHAVEVTALQHPADGETIIATLAATTAGAGSAYARADHPDSWTVDVPETPVYSKAVFVHPYKTHNYNRTNLKLVCPDGYVLDINATYDQPWDVSGHLLPGQTNTFSITNERTAGIDYWANGIATRAEYLTRLELSQPLADGISSFKTSTSYIGQALAYDLQGRLTHPNRKGLYIIGNKLYYKR